MTQLNGRRGIGGEVAVELDLPVDDLHLGGGIEDARGQRGGEIGQGKRLGADEYFARKAMRDANEIGRIGSGLLKGRCGNRGVAPGGGAGGGRPVHDSRLDAEQRQEHVGRRHHLARDVVEDDVTAEEPGDGFLLGFYISRVRKRILVKAGQIPGGDEADVRLAFHVLDEVTEHSIAALGILRRISARASPTRREGDWLRARN